MTKIWRRDPQDDFDVELDAKKLVGVPVGIAKPLKGILNEPLKVKFRYRGERPAAFAAGPIVVVDDRVREIVQSARTEAEFLPVELTDRKTREVVPAWLMNVLSELDCLDRAQSEYEDFAGYAQEIEKLRLKDGCATLDLFCLAYTLPTLLVASDDLARRLASVGRIGYRFVDVESYRDPALI